MVSGLLSQHLRPAEHHHGIGTPVRVERGHRGRGRTGIGLRRPQQAQLTGRRDHARLDRVEAGLTVGIEFAQRLQFVAEEFEADGPGPMQGPEVHDAPAPGQLPLVGHLRLGLVALRLEPLDEVQGIDRLPPHEGAGPGIEVLRGEGALLDGGDRGDDQRTGPGNRGRTAQGDQRFQSFTDDVGMGQAGLLGQRLPRGEELRTFPVEPGRRIGVQLLLGLEGVRDGHHRAVGVEPVQHRHQPRLGGGGHSVEAHPGAGEHPRTQALDDRRSQPALQHGGGRRIQAREAYPCPGQWRFWIWQARAERPLPERQRPDWRARPFRARS